MVVDFLYLFLFAANLVSKWNSHFYLQKKLKKKKKSANSK